MKQKLLEIGHYCATGGISVHINRLVELLDEDFDIKIIDESRLADNDGKTFNLRNKQIFKYFGFMRGAEVIHIHSTVPMLRFFHTFLGFLLLKKSVVTVHSFSLIKSVFDLFFLKFTLMFASKVIVVSEDLKKKLKIKNLIVLHAFLPPKLEDEKELPIEIIDELVRNESKKIVVSNAFRLNFFQGEDLYGLDLLLDVASYIKDNGDNIKIIFILTSLEINSDIYSKYKQRMIDEELDQQISIFTYPISFVRLINKSDLVVRATNTDGDALTVREAIFFNKSVIVSDAVARPDGVVLFKNRNSKDLYIKIKSTLSQNRNELESKKLDCKSKYLDILKL